MSHRTLKQQDVDLLLKAAIDFNSGVLGIVAQVTGNGVKPKIVFREIKRLEKQYKLVINEIAEKYENPELLNG